MIVLLASSSTLTSRCHFSLLEQSQNSTLLLLLRLKKGLRSRALFDDRKSVMTLIRSTSRELSLGILNRMASNSAFGAVIFPDAALEEMT